MTGRLAFLVASAALSGLAQTPASEPLDAARRGQIEAMLSSRAPDQLAWGAYLAAEYGAGNFVPTIIPLLRHKNPDVQIAAVDALIRLNADVPPEGLAGVRIDGTLDPVIVLLSRNSKKYSALLMDLLGQSLDDNQWVAVNSILWMSSPRGYAALLLRAWKLEVTIEVRDKPGYKERCCSGYFAGTKQPRDRSGFPPLWHYAVYEGVPRPSAMTGGPHPVSFIRQTEARKGGAAVPRDDYRKDYLEGLAHFELPQSVVTFRWADTAKFRADAEDLLARVHRCETELRRILLERGLVDASESTDGPAPVLTVVDYRVDQRIPLPSIQW
jgi:hypothetical protein